MKTWTLVRLTLAVCVALAYAGWYRLYLPVATVPVALGQLEDKPDAVAALQAFQAIAAWGWVVPTLIIGGLLAKEIRLVARWGKKALAETISGGSHA
jgi:hypothetical protein